MTTVLTMTEQQLQDAVIDLAHAFGYRVAHFRAAGTEHGWRTAVEADGAGFPDLVLARPRDGRLVFAELKSARGKLSADQWAWMDALADVPMGVGVYVWRPDDWTSGKIEEVLR